MNPYFISILTAIIFLIIGYFAGKLIAKLKYEKESSVSEAQTEVHKNILESKETLIDRLNEDVEILRKDKEDVNIDLTKKVSELTFLIYHQRGIFPDPDAQSFVVPITVQNCPFFSW